MDELNIAPAFPDIAVSASEFQVMHFFRNILQKIPTLLVRFLQYPCYSVQLHNPFRRVTSVLKFRHLRD